MAHAILVAYVDGKVLVLDSQIRTIVPVGTINQYGTVDSINEHGWWLHQGG